jgi:uncharacterized protein (TIGR03546 family)
MILTRSLRYYWLKILRLQDDPKQLAWGMALGVFIGMTPTMPFHTLLALSLAAFLGVSPVAAYLGIWVMNPVTVAPIYVAAYKVGKFLLYNGGCLGFPENYDYASLLQVLWRGGLAMQVGGIIIAVLPAILSYFLTLWAVQRYRQRKAQKAASVLRLSQNHSEPSGPEA